MHRFSRSIILRDLGKGKRGPLIKGLYHHDGLNFGEDEWDHCRKKEFWANPRPWLGLEKREICGTNFVLALPIASPVKRKPKKKKADTLEPASAIAESDLTPSDVTKLKSSERKWLKDEIIRGISHEYLPQACLNDFPNHRQAVWIGLATCIPVGNFEIRKYRSMPQYLKNSFVWPLIGRIIEKYWTSEIIDQKFKQAESLFADEIIIGQKALKTIDLATTPKDNTDSQGNLQPTK